MATKRGSILEYIRAAIEALASVSTAEINSTRALDSLDAGNLPYVNITCSGVYNEKLSATADQEIWDLTVNINIITLDNNAEEIRGDIKEAISADTTFGGLAKNTVYQSDSNFIDIAIPSNCQGTVMIYNITYKTAEGKKA